MEATGILEMLGKLNQVVIAKDSLPKPVDREVQLDRYTTLIQGFVGALKSAKPEHFPVAELAHKLVDSGG